MLEANALKKMGREAEAEAAYLRALEMAKSQP
jgi:Flp pilus assembly protein TadD